MVSQRDTLHIIGPESSSQAVAMVLSPGVICVVAYWISSSDLNSFSSVIILYFKCL